MTAGIKRVAVVGAGGNMGAFIVKGLLENGFVVSVITRPSSSSNFPKTVNTMRGEYTPAFLSSVFRVQDAVVLALSSEAIEEQKALIDAAVKAGVKRIIPSQFGSDIENPIAVKAVPFYQAKLDVSRYLESAVASAPGTSWTTVTCGPFFDWCLKQGFYGFDLNSHEAIIYDHGTAKFDTTNIDTVGVAVAKILAQPTKWKNEHVYIKSFTTTQQEILAALKTVTGVSDWKIKEENTKDYAKRGQEKLAQGNFYGSYDLIFATTFQAGNGQDYSSLHKISNEALGLPEEDFITVVKNVVETDRHVLRW